MDKKAAAALSAKTVWSQYFVQMAILGAGALLYFLTMSEVDSRQKPLLFATICFGPLISAVVLFVKLRQAKRSDTKATEGGA